MDAVQLGAAAGEGSAAALRHISSLSDAFEVGAAACPLTDIRGPVNGARCRELTWLCGPRCWGGRASDNSLHRKSDVRAVQKAVVPQAQSQGNVWCLRRIWPQSSIGGTRTMHRGGWRQVEVSFSLAKISCCEMQAWRKCRITVQYGRVQGTD